MATTTDVLVAEMRAKDRASDGIKKVSGEFAKLRQEFVLARPSIKQTVNAMRPMPAALDGIGRGLSFAASHVGGLVGAAVAASAALAKMLDRAGDVERIERAFNALGLGLGSAADNLQGLVSEFDLMSARVKSSLLQLNLTDDQFAELAVGAAKLGAALGQDVGKSLDDLFVGLGRQSIMILDNLGLTIKIEAANQKYADSIGRVASELTVEEQKAAFMAEALEQLREKSAALEVATGTGAEAFKRLKVAISDAFDAASKAVSSSELLAGALNLISGNPLIEARGKGIVDLDDAVRDLARGAVDGSLGVEAFAATMRTFKRAGIDVLPLLRDEYPMALASVQFLAQKAADAVKALAGATGAMTPTETVEFGEVEGTTFLGPAAAKAAREAAKAAADAMLEGFAAAMSGNVNALDEAISPLIEAALEDTFWEQWEDVNGELPELPDFEASARELFAENGRRAAEAFGKEFSRTATDLIALAIADMVGQLAGALVEFAATGEFAAEQFAGSMLRAIGQIATQLGTMLILSGTGQLALGAFTPLAAIAAGFALVALGGGLSAAGSLVGGAKEGGRGRGRGRGDGGAGDPFRGAGETAAGGRGREGPQNVTVYVDAGGQLIHTDEQIARRVQAVMKRGAASGATGGTGRRKIGKR